MKVKRCEAEFCLYELRLQQTNKQLKGYKHDLTTLHSLIQNQLIFVIEKSVCLINLTVPPSIPLPLSVSFSTGLSKPTQFKMEIHHTVLQCFLLFPSSLLLSLLISSEY